MKVEHLTSTAKLTTDCFVDDCLLMFKNIGLNRVTVLRSFLQNRHVTDSAHCHVESSGDRSSRKSKHVNIRISFLESLFLCNTESLFLVDDNKSQIAEFNIFLYKSVSTYHKVDFTAFKLL